MIFLCPETKGKTNEDMRNFFLQKAGKAPATGIENPNYEEEKEGKF